MDSKNSLTYTFVDDVWVSIAVTGLATVTSQFGVVSVLIPMVGFSLGVFA